MTDTTKKRRGGGIRLLFLLILLVALAWSGWWFYVARQAEARTDAMAQDLRRAGYQVSWSHRQVGGYPFRTYLRFRDFRIAAPSGHALAAPVLGAEAYAYALGHWVMSAPDGLTLTRGAKGDVKVTGRVIRASLAGASQPIPRLAMEWYEPVFTPAAGAEPFYLTEAKRIEAYLRPKAGAANQAEFLFQIEDGKGRPEGVLNWIAGGEPLDTRWAGTVTATDRFGDGSWSQVVASWSAAGGALADVQGEASAGDTMAAVRSSRLTVSTQGRLVGQAQLSLKGGPAALLALGRAPEVGMGAAGAAAALATARGGLSGSADLPVTFAEGESRIGPIRLAPAPKIY
jgi:hypothetical protein